MPAVDIIWRTAQADKAIELMPVREQRRDAERYRLAAQLDANWDRALPHLYEISALMLRSSASDGNNFRVDSLSPTQTDALSLSVSRARIALTVFEQNLAYNLRFYDNGERE